MTLKNLTTILLFVLGCNLSAQDLFWVGGSGSWNDPAHWSFTADGKGGAGVPDEESNVYFTQQSLQNDAVILIIEALVLNQLIIDHAPSFKINSEALSIDIKGKFEINANNFVLDAAGLLITCQHEPILSKNVSLPDVVFLWDQRLKIWKNNRWENYQSDQKIGHIVNFSLTPAVPACNGDSVNVLATASGGAGGPFEICFKGGDFGEIYTCQNPVKVTAGSYTIRAKDLSDNSFSFNFFQIVEPFSIEAVSTKVPPDCPGDSNGSLSISIFGGTQTSGYSVEWSTGLTENNVNSSTINNISAGPYFAVITDDNVCEHTFYDTLADIDPILLHPVITDVDCFGNSSGSIFLNPTSDNPGGFTYLWSPGGQTSSFIENQPIGAYDVHVEDIKGCPKDSTITIGQPTLLTASITDTTHLQCNSDCSIGQAIVTPVGGTPPYTYQWFDASMTPLPGYTDSTASNLCAGFYSVQVTDANSCTTTISNLEITQPVALTVVTDVVDASCNGYLDGSVVVTPSGGIEPYTYVWEEAGNPIGNDSLIENLPAGTYDYTVNDINSCEVSGSLTVNEPDTIEFVLSVTDIQCAGDGNGQAEVLNPTGGDGNYAYEWKDNSGTIIGTNPTISMLGTGNYTITVLDGNSCFATVDFSIQEPLPITLVLSADSASCFGVDDGAVNVVATGGTIAADYIYAWVDGGGAPVGNTANVSDLFAGLYTVTVTDDNGCSASDFIEVFEPDQLVATVDSITAVTCHGIGDGSIEIDISGGIDPIDISWTGPDGFTSIDEDIFNLNGGDYELILSDFNDCEYTNSYTVEEPDTLTFDTTIVHVACYGGSTGSIMVTVNGGNGGFIYEWQNESGTVISTNNEIVDVPAGEYALFVEDAKGCILTETFTVNEPSPFTFNAEITEITCNGAMDGTITLFPGGGNPGFDFTWSADNGFASTDQNIVGLDAGFYTVNVLDNAGCTYDTSMAIVDPPILVVDSTVTPVTCAGDMDGSIELSVSGGVPDYMFNWTGPDGFTSTDEDVFNLNGGSYDLILEDDQGCVVNLNFTVEEPEIISFDATITNVACGGASSGAISVIVNGGNGGFIYEWKDEIGTIISTTDEILDVPAGDYILFVVDSKGCNLKDTLTILDGIPFFFNGIVTPIECFNAMDGAIDLFPAGGNPGYDFLWNADNGFSSTDQNINGLGAGVYTCEVTDNNSCVYDTTIALSNPDEIVVAVDSITDVSCHGFGDGSIEITISGGVDPIDISWTGPDGFSSTDTNIFNLNGGEYFLNLEDDRGCEFNPSFTVLEPDSITFDTTITHVACFGESTGSISVVVNGGNGGFIYQWTNESGTIISTSNEILDVPAGDYALFVEDPKGCNQTDTFTILQSPEFFFNGVITPITCNGLPDGAIELFPTGGSPNFDFLWDGPGGFASTDQNISGLEAGVYVVEATDAINCVNDTMITLINPAGIVVEDTITPVECNGEANGCIGITISGGVPPYDINWTGPGGFNSTDEDICDLPAGIYNLLLIDGTNCPVNLSYEVLEPELFSVEDSIVDVLCTGDSSGVIVITVSGGNGGYTYDWRDDDDNQVGTTDTLSNVPGGIYSVLITDSKGCDTTLFYLIDQPATAITLEPFADPVNCYGDSDGTVGVLISGGTVNNINDYVITWTNTQGTVIGNSPIISNLLPADTFYVSVTDLNNCLAIDTAIVLSPDSIVIDFDVIHPLCAGDETGSATAIVSGGTVIGDYSYIWEDTANPGLPISFNNQIIDVGTGIYEVTVTDANFCPAVDTIEIVEPDSIDLSYTFTEPNCFSEENGQIEVFASGGTVLLDYTYEWQNSSSEVIGTNALISGIEAGEYYLSVTDDNGCIALDTLTLNQPDSIQFAAEITQITCFGDDDGSIAVLVTGGTEPYDFEWQDEFGLTLGTDTIIENLPPGDYTFLVSDFNGCLQQETYTILIENPIVLTATQYVLGNCSPVPPCIGAAYVEPSGGSGVFVSYEWFDFEGNDLGINNDTATTLCAGSYLVTVTDSDGCTGSIAVTIEDDIAEDLSVSVVDATCFGGLGTATAEYLCIDLPCSIEWFDAITNTSLGLFTDQVQLPAGDYFVQLTNGLGCKNFFSFIMGESSPIIANLSATGISCADTCDGTATASPTGGSGDFIFLWNDPLAQTTPSAIALCAGSYAVTITDVLDATCFITDTIEVENLSPLVSNDTITPVSCFGDSDGVIALYPSGGSGLYTYTWSPAPPIGDGTATGSGLSVGEYAIQISDAEHPNCFITVNYTIEQPELLTVDISTTQSTCGNNDGSATASPTGGTPPFAYLWDDPLNQTTQTAINLNAGFYNVLVSDSLGCIAPALNAVSDADADTLLITLIPGPCFEDSTTVIASYECTNPECVIYWFDEFGNDLMLTGDTVKLPSGDYWAGIINGSDCKWYTPFTVAPIVPIEANLFTLNESCFGPCDGIATANPTGGTGEYTFIWSPEPPFGQGTDSISGLCAGDWQLAIIDEEGCDTTFTFSILPESPIIPNLVIQDALCFGDSSGVAEVSPTGGNGFYTYLWAPEPLSGQGTPASSGLYAGDWSVTITDTSSCDTTVSFSIDQPLPLEADSTVINASCQIDPPDGQIALSVTGGTPPYNYQWFDADGNDLGVNNDTLADVASGIYNAVVTDSRDCSRTFVALISETPSETISIDHKDVVCNGADDGMAWVIYECGDAPCSVEWFDNLGVSLNVFTDTLMNLAPGDYIVGVTNASLCTVYLPVTIGEPPVLLLTVVPSNATCSGVCDGSAEALVSGGIAPYTYAWTPDPIIGQGASTVTQLCAGDYSLNLTDSFGCSQTFDFSIVELEGISSNPISNNNTCNGSNDGWASVDPTGTSGNYGFNWLPEPAFGQGTDSAYGLYAGQWTVLITDLDNGCNLTDTFQISEPEALVITDTLYEYPECDDDFTGKISIKVEGGTKPYAYQWYLNDDLIPEANDSLVIGGPGLYRVEIIDALGCPYEESYTLGSQSDLFATAIGDTVYCDDDGPATLIGTGNGPTHLWFDDAGNVIETSDTLVVDPPPGLYIFIFSVTDGICTVNDTVVVEVKALPDADAGPDFDIIEEESIQIGGNPTAPFNATVVWNPIAGLNDPTAFNPIATPFVSTNYVVFVTGENTCLNSDTVYIRVVPEFVPNDGFTPNDDGINDVWIIGNIDRFPDIEVTIVNRWGQVLYSSTGYDEPWDGRFADKPLPVGTYYYVIDLHDPKYPEPFTGPITIMR